MTTVARLLVVFHFLRKRWLTSNPTNQTLIGLSLVLTFFLMQQSEHPSTTKRYFLEQGQINAWTHCNADLPRTPIHVHYVRERLCYLWI